MSNVIDLSKVRLERERSRRLQSEGTGCIVLVTTSGKIAAFLGHPDTETGDAIFVDQHEAYYGPMSRAKALVEKLRQTPSALLMAMGGFHLEAVSA
ncbi:MAG TPA: hypothetical protein ENJ90_08450 [Devosia sp.]|nr:hypothetical protein [Devosia sp.]